MSERMTLPMWSAQQGHTALIQGGNMTKDELLEALGEKPPERIYGWLNTQMSIARHYGGLKYQGYDYVIAYEEPDQPLVRVDVVKKEAKAAKEKKRELSKTIWEKIVDDQGALL